MGPLIRDYSLPQWLRRIAFGVCSTALVALLGLNWMGKPSGSLGHVVALWLLDLSVPVGLASVWVATRFPSTTAFLNPLFPRPAETEVEPIIMRAPNVSAEELAAKVQGIVQKAEIEITPINPKYGSWNLHVTKGKLDMEYIWGPSGFGGSDLARPMTDDDNPFAWIDEEFHSIEEGLEFLRRLTQKYL